MPTKEQILEQLLDKVIKQDDDTIKRMDAQFNLAVTNAEALMEILNFVIDAIDLVEGEPAEVRQLKVRILDVLKREFTRLLKPVVN